MHGHTSIIEVSKLSQVVSIDLHLGKYLIVFTVIFEMFSYCVKSLFQNSPKNSHKYRVEPLCFTSSLKVILTSDQVKMMFKLCFLLAVISVASAGRITMRPCGGTHVLPDFFESPDCTATHCILQRGQIFRYESC